MIDLSSRRKKLKVSEFRLFSLMTELKLIKTNEDKCIVCAITETDCQKKFEGMYDDCGLSDSKRYIPGAKPCWGKLGRMCPDCIYDADNNQFD